MGYSLSDFGELFSHNLDYSNQSSINGLAHAGQGDMSMLFFSAGNDLKRIMLNDLKSKTSFKQSFENKCSAYAHRQNPNSGRYHEMKKIVLIKK